ncbi:Hydratase/decarboxylase [Methylobacterium sp. 4-46]|uniref:2-keto-4-pentenoate hydratase n=1 Tax=unclassified Methylobacterium TaxID=2615210 RepID=UPI000152DDF3|nr:MULTISPECIES: hydratase [Methylobacterium]ACA15581.1 Hydratase/decarboxylase [Methylobacterium sp. 4-46]WFT81294.1 hydratase [Methylobacterium nodulans]
MSGSERAPAEDREAPSPDAVARAVLAALDERRQIAPLGAEGPGLRLDEAYRVTASVRRIREARGERAVGRKIGFTNTTIWDEYGVRAPIWGYVYDTTLHRPEGLAGTFSLARTVEPRIEPEIVLGLARAPEPDMDEAALLGCLDFVAHGFEVVQSLFPGWRFTAADTVAAFGLHGALLMGPPAAVTPANAAAWGASLAGFRITLLRDGAEADRGRAENVLGGGPLAALRHLVRVLAEDPESPPLAAGEVVTTGTLTRALPVAPGETWSTRLDGLPLAGVTVAFA